MFRFSFTLKISLTLERKHLKNLQIKTCNLLTHYSLDCRLQVQVKLHVLLKTL